MSRFTLCSSLSGLSLLFPVPDESHQNGNPFPSEKTELERGGHCNSHEVWSEEQIK